MELLLLLVTVLAVVWGVNKFRASKIHKKAEKGFFKEKPETTSQDIQRAELASTHDRTDKLPRLVEPLKQNTDATKSSIDEDSDKNRSQSVLRKNNLHQILEDIVTFPANEVFDSIPEEKKLKITAQLDKNSVAREKDRHERLARAEFQKQKALNELDAVEFAIAENNEWFVAAKNGDVEFTPESLNQHRRKAEALYSRKNNITTYTLPEADSRIKKIISQIESEERKETIFKKQDLEELLRPFYQKMEHARRKVVVAEVKERMRRREEEDNRKQKEHEALRDRWHAENLEKTRIAAEKRQKKREEDLRTRVDARKIRYLVHFTPIANLESILKHGLMSRSALNGHQYVCTDDHRSDGWLDWISLSVSFPNYKMLYAKKNLLNDVDGWAILLIRKEALWELNCKFILTNAASYGIRMFRDEKWSSVEAFEDMFSYSEHRGTIPDYFTTDPQAEVMIKNKVPRCYFDGISVERKTDVKRLNNLQDMRVEKTPELFAWRRDFEHWRKFRLSPNPSEANLVAFF